MKKILFFLTISIILTGLFAADLVFAIQLTNPLGGTTTVTQLITQVSTYVRNIVGVIAVLMFVIAGIAFIVSGGKPERVALARRIAVWAAVGAGIALAADMLVNLVNMIITSPAPAGGGGGGG